MTEELDGLDAKPGVVDRQVFGVRRKHLRKTRHFTLTHSPTHSPALSHTQWDNLGSWLRVQEGLRFNGRNAPLRLVNRQMFGVRRGGVRKTQRHPFSVTIRFKTTSPVFSARRQN